MRAGYRLPRLPGLPCVAVPKFGARSLQCTVWFGFSLQPSLGKQSVVFCWVGIDYIFNQARMGGWDEQIIAMGTYLV